MRAKGKKELDPLKRLYRDVTGKPLHLDNNTEAFFTEVLTTTLTPSEEEIIRRRFGIGEFRSPQTLGEISAHFALSEDRIRRIEKNAKQKLAERMCPTPAQRRAKKAREEQRFVEGYMPILMRTPADLLGASVLGEIIRHQKLLARALNWARKNLKECVKQAPKLA